MGADGMHILSSPLTFAALNALLVDAPTSEPAEGGLWIDGDILKYGEPPEPAYYVDPVSGSDANSGLSEASPKATFASVFAAWNTAGNPERFCYLKRGTTIYEEFAPGANGLHLDAYGTGPLPVIDASEIATAWTASGTANVYQITWSHDPVAIVGEFPVVEDDVQLLEAASLAACSSTPGSFYHPTLTTSPTTVYVHPTDSGDPASNGKEYRIPVRSQAVLVGDDTIIRNVVGTTQLHTGGAIKGINRCNWENVVSRYGHLHSAFVGSGDTKKLVAVGWTDGMPIVNYTIDGPDAEREFTHTGSGVIYLGAEYRENTGFYAHGSSGPYPYVYSQLRDCFTYRCRPCSLRDIDIDGFISRDGGFPESGGSCTYDRVFLEVINTSARYQVFGDNPVWTDSAFILRGSGATAGLAELSGSGITLQNFVYYNEGRRQWASSVQAFFRNFNKVIFFGASAATSHQHWTNGDTNTGAESIDQNLYYVPGAHQIRLRWNGVNYFNLATFQSASGHDLNSAYLTDDQAALFWLGDPKQLDLRISPTAECTWADGTVATTLPDGTPLTDLGVRNPPSAWPKIPTNYAETLDYIAGVNGPWYGDE